MRIFRHTAGLPESVRGGAVAVGNFDGVHRGHQAVIGEAGRLAGELGATLTVLTFEPHPRRFFRPEEPEFQLTPLRSKVRHMRALGVDTLQIIHFDEEFSKATAETFVTEIMADGLGARHVVVGFDFVFGHGRTGNVDLLRRMAPALGFAVSAIEPVRADDGPVYSSTNIRTFLTEGKPRQATGLLGRVWEIEGRVLHGDRRGREIGFPTANLALDGYVEPALGVYAVWAGIEDRGETKWHMGVANIGRRPTFDGDGVVIEVYIFDFADDIYDRLLRVALVDYIRPEVKFEGVSVLREQIAKDCGAARSLLESIDRNDIDGPPRLPGVNP